MTPQEQLAVMAQIDNHTNNEMNEMDRNFLMQQHVTNTLAEEGEPKEEDVANATSMFREVMATTQEIKFGVAVGAVKGINNALLYTTDITGMETAHDYLEKFDTYITDKYTMPSTVGKVSETVGSYGVGFFLTRGIGAGLSGGARVSAEAVKGGAIDFLAFKGEEGNIADLIKSAGAESEVVNYLTTQEDDSETVQRFKNSVTGMGVGVALEALFKVGKVLMKREASETGKIFKGTDEEVVEHAIDLVKADAKKVAENPQFKAQMPDIELPKMPKTDLKDAYVKMADNFIDGSDDVSVDMLKPFNAPKIATEESQKVFAKATEDIEAVVPERNWKETAKIRDEELRANLDDEAYDVMDDLMKTASKVEDLDVVVSKQRVILGSMAQKLNDSIKIAKKEGGASSKLQVIQDLDRLVNASTAVKTTQTNVARSMSAMRMNSWNTKMLNDLKLLDNIDPDYSLKMLKEAIAKGDDKALDDLMNKLDDPLAQLKDTVDNYQDGFWTKLGNVLSETTVANMLSSPSTLAVNVIGNSLVKQHRLIQDLSQYAWGFVTRNKDRMKSRELRRLIQANIGHNLKDAKEVSFNLKAWADSGFEDETFDKAVLARYIQDQAFQHKYTSSQYIRGLDVGNQNTAFNNTLNTLGKVARLPYRTIGAVDDYYKRGAFRAELTRLGSKLADAKGVSDKDYDGFMDRFIKANTSLHIMRNNGERPTASFLKQYEDVTSSGLGLYRYADEAVDNANYMTFQSELTGVTGDIVDVLNSNGYFRVIIPFKLTPINILKKSASIAKEALSPLRKQFYDDVFVQGGIKRDIALAKLTTSASMVTAIGYLASSGNMTGTFKPEERRAMQNAGVPELSFKVGDKWFDYKQVEPLATIAGVMTDLFRIQNDARIKFEDIDAQDVNEEVMNVMGDLMLSVAGNITNKTYAKSLSEIMGVVTGEQSLVDYSGNLISSAVPMSSLANFAGRTLGEPYKYEAVTFTEKIMSKYKGMLDRKALDAFGRYIPETEYTPVLTKALTPRKNNEGAEEVGRLGIILPKMAKEVSYKGISVKLEAEEYHRMRRSMEETFGLANKLNNTVKSAEYKEMSDALKTRHLKNIITKVRSGATKRILQEDRIKKEVLRQADKRAIRISDTEIKETYNNMIFDLIEGDE